MRLGIENEFAQIDFVSIVAEQQVEVLQQLSKVERLHEIPRTRIKHALHVSDRRVSVPDPRVLLERLENGPAHVLVGGIARQRVEVVQTLDELRPEQVVGVIGLDVDVRLALAIQIEVDYLGSQ